MARTRRTRRTAGLAAALALTGALAADAQATNDRADRGARANQGHRADAQRVAFATTADGRLVSFRVNAPQRLRSDRLITGLPAGVEIVGIDFRPATGDLYGVGSDSVVYRISTRTAIAVAEGPAFTPRLSGTAFGFDFNPTVDKIRLTSDAEQNLRLDPDSGAVIGVDSALNPGNPTVVGSAYTNSSFSATRPTATTLYAVDAQSDTLLVQAPPNAGTLTQPRPLGVDVTTDAGFDIAGAGNRGYLVTNSGRRGAILVRFDLATGRTERIKRVGSGVTLTGLAVAQDQ